MDRVGIHDILVDADIDPSSCACIDGVQHQFHNLLHELYLLYHLLLDAAGPVQTSP